MGTLPLIVSRWPWYSLTVDPDRNSTHARMSLNHRGRRAACSLPGLVALFAAGTCAHARNILDVERLINANFLFDADGLPGAWTGSVANGLATAIQISVVEPTHVSAFGEVSALWPIPNQASSSIDVVFELPQWTTVQVIGVLGAYRLGPDGLSAGNCTMSLVGPNGLVHSAHGPLTPPFIEPLITVVAPLLPPGTYTLSIQTAASAQGVLPFNGVSMFGFYDFDVTLNPIACGITAAGSCYVPHLAPQCEESVCCNAVCAIDPGCCTDGWDSFCVEYALASCSHQPVNDECENATPILEGETLVSTHNATGVFTLPIACDEGYGPNIANNVFFRYAPTATGPVTISSCEVFGFDTRLAVFTGPCANPQVIACNDDNECAMLGAEVQFYAVEGEVYTIVLGSYRGGSGLTALTLTQDIAPPTCLGDIVFNGAVDAADLAALLATWGTSTTEADLDGSGQVGAPDLAILLAAWGPCSGRAP